MANTSSDLSLRAYLIQLPRAVLIGVLQAFGILPLPGSRHPGAYWARDQLGRWELRVPAHGIDERPPR